MIQNEFPVHSVGFRTGFRGALVLTVTRVESFYINPTHIRDYLITKDATPADLVELTAKGFIEHRGHHEIV